MSETSERFRKVADTFTARVTTVPDSAWDNPSPCPDWVTRDVVRHLVDTTNYFLGQAGVGPVEAPSVDDDPVGAWTAARDAVQAALGDPELATREYDTGMGRMTLEKMIGMFGVADVLIHTWDLARAAGLDDTLDPEEVRRVYAMMEPNDAMLRQGTAFGPRVEVPDDADEQTKLIAFTGRQP